MCKIHFSDILSQTEILNHRMLKQTSYLNDVYQKEIIYSFMINRGFNGFFF